ncbi:MAG: hypothetical protein ACLRSW_15825 [Christensenellaceae bacterium]
MCRKEADKAKIRFLQKDIKEDMEIGLKAFFYEYKYYLLPDGCADAEDVRN